MYIIFPSINQVMMGQKRGRHERQKARTGQKLHCEPLKRALFIVKIKLTFEKQKVTSVYKSRAVAGKPREAV